MDSTDLHVIIIGAGSTGLLLAQGLKQNGIKATVCEREDSTTYQDRPREWGMTLHWGTSFIATCIPPELRPKMDESIRCDPHQVGKDLSLPHFNTQTGEKLFETPGDKLTRISRKKLRNFLSQGLDIQYGKKLEEIRHAPDEKVTAVFVNGDSMTGSCIVGCDGAGSVVRRCLVGEAASKTTDIDIQMFNVCCTFPREVSLQLRRFGHPVFKNSYHPDGFMWWQSVQSVDDIDRPETWLWQNILSWQGPPRASDLPDQASRYRYWREQGEKAADPWRTVARNLADDLQFGVDRTRVWKPFDWSEMSLAGKVTLAGDAAHPMPAHRGQGLNNALEDSAKLVEQLKLAHESKQSLAAGLKSFEDEMRQRANTEISISMKQAKMAHEFQDLMESPLVKMGINKYRQEQAQKESAVS